MVSRVQLLQERLTLYTNLNLLEQLVLRRGGDEPAERKPRRAVEAHVYNCVGVAPLVSNIGL